MGDCVSVINCGSSSIKFSLYGVSGEGQPQLIFRGQVSGIGVAPQFKVWDRDGETLAEQLWENSGYCDHSYLLEHTIGWIKTRRTRLGLVLRGVGHRVVHGGQLYDAPVVVDRKVLQDLERLTPLAPLHQPHNVAAVRAVMELSGDVPQIACFDTAFHRSIPQEAEQFALPRWLTEEGVRRYGFHGLSYEYVATKLQQLAPEISEKRLVIAHLGSGASMCGLFEGRSVASSMGFTALDGLVMGTRPGNIDPGVVLYLLQEKGMDADTITELLYKKSGLLGVSGISSDMRSLLSSNNPRAEEAVTVFLYRVKRELGSLVAALNGFDGLIFTGGIGENSPVIRKRICEQATWTGLLLDDAKNSSEEMRINSDDSPISVWVVPTNEELMIATHTLKLLGLSG